MASRREEQLTEQAPSMLEGVWGSPLGLLSQRFEKTSMASSVTAFSLKL